MSFLLWQPTKEHPGRHQSIIISGHHALLLLQIDYLLGHLPSLNWYFEVLVDLLQFDFNYSLGLLLVPDCFHHPLGSVDQSFHCQDRECLESIPTIWFIDYVRHLKPHDVATESGRPQPTGADHRHNLHPLLLLSCLRSLELLGSWAFFFYIWFSVQAQDCSRDRRCEPCPLPVSWSL